MARRIKGTVKHLEFEGGFWGIIGDDNYYPLNFPEQLKTDGAQIECTIEIMDDVMTSVSWGLPCRIHSFKTINP